MAKVSIPSSFQKYFSNKTEISIQATSLEELLKKMESSFPEAKGKILGIDGKLNRFVRIFVDSKDIAELDKLNTELNEKSKVKILMALAGG